MVVPTNLTTPRPGSRNLKGHSFVQLSPAASPFARRCEGQERASARRSRMPREPTRAPAMAKEDGPGSEPPQLSRSSAPGPWSRSRMRRGAPLKPGARDTMAAESRARLAGELRRVTLPSRAPVRRPVIGNPTEMRWICRKLVHDAEHHAGQVAFAFRFLQGAEHQRTPLSGKRAKRHSPLPKQGTLSPLTSASSVATRLRHQARRGQRRDMRLPPPQRGQHLRLPDMRVIGAIGATAR